MRITDSEKLNEIEFDTVFTVTDDGCVIDGPAGVYAPNLMDEALDSESWEFWSTGYSGQDSYRGPIMHNSEYLGGGMARDLLAQPGTYALVVAYWSPDDPEIPEDFPVRPVPYSDAPGIATCGTCGLSWDDSIATSYTPTPAARCPFESFHDDGDTAEGWAVVRLAHDDD